VFRPSTAVDTRQPRATVFPPTAVIKSELAGTLPASVGQKLEFGRTGTRVAFEGERCTAARAPTTARTKIMTNHKPVNRVNAASALSLPRTLLHQGGKTWEQVPTLQEINREDSRSASIRSIVVPLDGSLHAEHALPHALAIARRSCAVVRLVHVHSRLDHVEPWQTHNSFETNERRKREKGNYLLDVVDRIARTDFVTVEAILIDGNDTEDSLLKATASADLVVMASRRRGFFRRLWTYSVADSLRRRLQVPVLFVRGYPSPVDLTGDPIARHILVHLDGSTVAERILGPATAIGRLEGAALTLLNVQNSTWTSGIFEHTNPPGYLIGIARDVRKAGSVVDAHLVTTERPLVRAVTSFAESRKADLIALATRSERGITRLLRGSLADRLIRRTDLPILLLGIDVERERAEVTTVVG
jgi:nucleotide-binding universal stress UspA family protein